MGASESSPTCDFCSVSKRAETTKIVRIPQSPRKRDSAGVGAVFGVDGTGAVFFTGAVLGSSCSDAQVRGILRKGDVLFQVNDTIVYRSPLTSIASHLMGPVGSKVKMVFRRDGEDVVLELERRHTDQAEARKTLEAVKQDTGVNRVLYGEDIKE